MSDTTTTTDTGVTRAEVCCVAVAEAFRGDGERLANPIGTIPMIGGRLARETFEPDLVMTDGWATFTSSTLSPGADPYSLAYNPHPPVEFAAIGVDVEVPWTGDDGSIVATGNSFAAPHVAGLVALIRSKHPHLTPFQVKTVLQAASDNAV